MLKNRASMLCVLLASAVMLSGCELNHVQSTFVAKGPVAQREYDLFLVTLWVTVAIFIVVTSALAYAIVRFKERPTVGVGGPAPLPPQVHGNLVIELGLAVASALLLLIIAVPTVQGIFYTTDVPEESAASAKPGSAAAMGPLTVKVIGHQWWWEFEYPDSKTITGNELHIPTGRPIHFDLHSEDVIHSFWVPRLAGKVDVIPNQKNRMWFQADEVGEYYGQCAEFCGTSHALMRFRVIAQPEPEFEAWLADQNKSAVAPPTSDVAAQAGLKIVETKCAQCHTVRGTNAGGSLGPDLTHVYSRTMIAAGVLVKNDENIKTWIHNPQAVKPGAKMLNLGLSEEELNNVVAFIRTLK